MREHCLRENSGHVDMKVCIKMSTHILHPKTLKWDKIYGCNTTKHQYQCILRNGALPLQHHCHQCVLTKNEEI